MHEVEHALDGNLCRCTGYRPILQAFRAFSSEDASAKDFVNKACDTIFPEELKVEVPSAVTYKGDETIVRVFPAVFTPDKIVCCPLQAAKRCGTGRRASRGCFSSRPPTLI